MGDIKRKKKKFSRPKQLFDRERIDSENKIVKRFGLKNKKEIWKAESEISKVRRQAKNLIPRSDAEKAQFFDKLNKIGFKISDISDVLALTGEDFLERRLQTFVFKKNLAHSPQQARQLIVHKKVLVDGKVVNIPSFIVSRDLENKILLKEQKVKMKKQETPKKEDGKVEVKELNEEQKNGKE
ncbi:30S ribosomal protein S4 [Candidatus Pacearchaeota archaeon]|nr:30S ribosomal protein S4 [Candidatus Pacearchaeota archaeon]|tara:strand:- start:938 stop:1486 length:549 start_codon:yes stop_codon:yes gene_type:complete